jgi:putative ABC transport system substrate-binding protein
VEDRVSLEGYRPYDQYAAELVGAKVDVIVAYGTTAAAAAAKATKEIPIVAIVGTDPVKVGLVRSLSRPGTNVTGITTLTVDLAAKRTDLLRELIPGLSRVGFVFAANVNNPNAVREAQAIARALSLEARFAEVRSPEDVAPRIAELANAGVEAIHVTPGSVLIAHSAAVVEAMARHRIPAVYSNERYVDAGGLMNYSGSVNKAFVRVAGYVDRVLRGARPADLAIEQTSELELVVNLKTARTLGITVPPSILVRADRVIE